MHIKYFQQLHDILANIERVVEGKKLAEQYADRPQDFPREPFEAMLVDTWGYLQYELVELEEDYSAIRYLSELRLNCAHDTGCHKPTQQQVVDALTRYKAFLTNIHGITDYNLNDTGKSALTRKEYKACNHYIFKMSLQAWYDKLPEYIPTFDEKYPKFNKQLPIPEENLTYTDKGSLG